MKYFLSLAFLLNMFGLVVFAQPPAPPTPLIYKSPQKSDLEEFVSKDKTFQITFPGVPQVIEQSIEKALVTRYLVYRQGSNSIVTTTDFNFDLDDTKEKIYELVKDGLLKTPKSKLEAERKVQINGKTGREFDVLHSLQYQKVRIFVLGKRVYEIKSDVTNWHIIGDATKKQFFDETERFFNSFKFNNLPENAVSQTPADFLGTADNTSYKNTFFGFTFDFPKDWHRLTNAEMQASKDGGNELLKTENERVNKAFEEATKREVAIFAITQKNLGSEAGTNLAIGVLKQPNSTVSAEAVAVATQKFLLTSPKIKLLNDTQKVKINKTPFSTFTVQTDINGIILDQKVYITMRKGYSLTFALTYQNSESQKAIEKIMQTLKFDAK